MFKVTFARHSVAFLLCLSGFFFVLFDVRVELLILLYYLWFSGTVEKIRSQRAHSIQMPDQYLFCHTAVLECAVSAGLLDGEELVSLEDDESSDAG